MAVSRATELGATRLAIPSAGNAAGAMAAYAALKGVPAHVFMPIDVPTSFIAECTAFGAEINLVKGLITGFPIFLTILKNTRLWCKSPRRSRSERLVRCKHASRTVSSRRQENDGIRDRRAIELGSSRCNHLSHWRGYRSYRCLERIRRDGRIRGNSFIVLLLIE
jgi:hypothetical protein